MRVTDQMKFEQVNRNIQKNRSEMSDLQNQAATQKRVTKPSDDPVASARVLSTRTEARGSEQFVKNINVARSFLEYTDQSLSELAEAMMRAKELAVSQANDAGASPDTRRVVAMEMEQIYSQAVQIGNRKLGDRYIFSGYKTTTSPFSNEGEYRGDDGDIKLQINKDAFVAMNISGNKILLGEGLSEDGLFRSNSINPKDPNGLDDLKFQNLQKELQRIEQEQEAMPLRAPASNSPRVGGAYESVPGPDAGGINILKALKDFEISLRVNDKEGIQRAIDDMDQSITQVVNARAQVGSRVMTLNAAQDSLQKGILESKTTASQLEDADVFQVVSDINKTDSTLKATLETSGKLIQPSLLDFLR